MTNTALADCPKCYVSKTGMMVDPARLGNTRKTKVFKPFYVEKSVALAAAVQDGTVAAGLEMLVAELPDGTVLTFTKRQLAYHHIAQGRAGGVDWMFSFCVICNSGTMFDAHVAGRTRRFHCGGVYNGMMIMQDKQSGSWWDHMTGECLHGELAGSELAVIGSVLHMNVDEALRAHPQCRLAISSASLWQRFVMGLQDRADSKSGDLFLPPGFRASVGTVDTRLDEATMGLGVWDSEGAQFLPTAQLKALGGSLVTVLAGARVRIMLSGRSGVPQAFFAGGDLTEAEDDGVLHFADGSEYRDGRLWIDGENITKRPLQLLSRWYGFSLTFPQCVVTGGD